MNPFIHVPKVTFMSKMIVPVIVSFFMGIVVMGLLADPATFQPKPIKSSSVNQEMQLPASLQGLSQGGLNHWRTILFFATHIPEVCWGENAVNDFQKNQCSEFWEHLEMGAGLSVLPFALAWFFYQSAMGALEGVYRRGRKRVDGGKPIGSAMVTNPAQAPGDMFSRLYCLRPISVQLASGKQMKVYSPYDAPTPLPGLTMAIFEPILVFGEMRHFAIIYAPHVAVVSGVRHG